MHNKYLLECYCPNVTKRKRERISFIIELSLKFFISIFIERSNNDASEVEMFFFSFELKDKYFKSSCQTRDSCLWHTNRLLKKRIDKKKH